MDNNYKKLEENVNDILFDIAKDSTKFVGRAATKPIRSTYNSLKDNKTYNKLRIQDIIDYVSKKYKIQKKNCNLYGYEVDRYNCQIGILNAKIKDLKNNLKNCRYTSNESVCKLRILQKIDKYNSSINVYEEKIKESQIEYLQAQNAREFDPDVYYGNEYETMGDD